MKEPGFCEGRLIIQATPFNAKQVQTGCLKLPTSSHQDAAILSPGQQRCWPEHRKICVPAKRGGVRDEMDLQSKAITPTMCNELAVQKLSKAKKMPHKSYNESEKHRETNGKLLKPFERKDKAPHGPQKKKQTCQKHAKTKKNSKDVQRTPPTGLLVKAALHSAQRTSVQLEARCWNSFYIVFLLLFAVLAFFQCDWCLFTQLPS